MSRRTGISTVVLALLVGLCAALGSTAAQEAAAGTIRIEDLGWLAGSWAGEIRGAGSATRFETHYTTPQGGVILSTSKAFRADGKISWFEFERFETRDGRLTVTPYPGGKENAWFTLAEYDPAAKKAVFTNAEHDYPNRITYQRTAEDRLFVIVAGNSKDAPVMEFSLSRQP